MTRVDGIQTNVSSNVETEQKKRVEQNDEVPVFPEQVGTGHSDQLDIKREAYQQAQLELSRKETEYTGKKGTVNYVEGSDILVKNIEPMGRGLTYVGQLETLLEKLRKAKEAALKEESGIKEETRKYLNEHLDITDFENDAGYQAIKAKALAVQEKIDAIDKNISLVTKTYLEPAQTELAALEAAKETAEKELEKAKKKANSLSARTEARHKANVEKREADKKAQTDYNAAVKRAEDKKEANRIAIEQGAEPTAENLEKYVQDVHNAFVAKEHAEAFQTMALDDLKKEFGSQLQDVDSIDLTIEAQLTKKVEELKASVIEKNNDVAVKMDQLKNHEIEGSVLQKAQEELEQLRKELQTAQTLKNKVTKFLDTEHEFKLEDGTTSTQTYRAAIGGVAAADEAFRKAQETAYKQLEQTYNQEIKEAKTAKDEALNTNKDYRKALKSQIRMLTPEVFNHVNKTKEDAINYGKEIVARYAEDVQDKIVVDAKEVTDKKGHKSYVAVYKDLNGNEIKDFKAFLLSDKKDLPAEKAPGEEVQHEEVQPVTVKDVQDKAKKGEAAIPTETVAATQTVAVTPTQTVAATATETEAVANSTTAADKTVATAGNKTTEEAIVYIHNGDTLKKIAARFGVSEDEIKSLNPHIFGQHTDCSNNTIKYLVAGKAIKLPAGVDKAKVESDQAQFNPQKIEEQYIAKVTSDKFFEKNAGCYSNIKAAGPVSQKALFVKFETRAAIEAVWGANAGKDWAAWKSKQP